MTQAADRKCVNAPQGVHSNYIKPNKKALMNKLSLLSSLLIGCALLSGCAAGLVSNTEKLIIVKGRPSQAAEARILPKPNARSAAHGAHG
jgi:hypothetical protein